MIEATFQIALKGQQQVLSVTDGVEALLGYTPEDFLCSKVSLADLIHPHDANIAGALFSLDIHIGCGVFNIRLRHADRRIHCVHGQCTKKAGQMAESY